MLRPHLIDGAFCVLTILTKLVAMKNIVALIILFVIYLQCRILTVLFWWSEMPNFQKWIDPEEDYSVNHSRNLMIFYALLILLAICCFLCGPVLGISTFLSVIFIGLTLTIAKKAKDHFKNGK